MTYKRIFIIGYPGSGKGLIAKLVSEKLGWDFIDADLGIEFNIGRTIKDIVGEKGLAAFHQCGNEVVTTLKSTEFTVITTDGSIVCDERNRELLKSECVVYLKASTSTQIERMVKKQSPLLPIDTTQFLNQLHQERDSWNESISTLIIDTEKDDVENHVFKITSLIIGTAKAADFSSIDVKDLFVFHRKTHLRVELTVQQAVCLKRIAQGKSAKEVGRALEISYRTVEGHIANIMELTGCQSSKELIALYHDHP